MNEDQLRLCNFVKEVKKIDGNVDINFSEIYVYTKNEATKEIAQSYLNDLERIITTIDSSKISKNDKESYKYAITKHLATKCESECKSIIINTLGVTKKKFQLMVKTMHAELQKERDEHNALRRKYNEKLKAVEVELPSIDLSLTLRNKKTLTNQECLNFLNDIDFDDKELSEKFKRVSVSEEFPNISRAYVKKGKGSENNIIQKQNSK